MFSYVKHRIRVGSAIWVCSAAMDASHEQTTVSKKHAHKSASSTIDNSENPFALTFGSTSYDTYTHPKQGPRVLNGGVWVKRVANITSVDLSSVTAIEGDVLIESDRLKTFTMPNVAKITGDITIDSNSTEELDIGSMQSISGSLVLKGKKFGRIRIPSHSNNIERYVNIELLLSWIWYAPEILYQNLGIDVQTISITLTSGQGSKYGFWNKTKWHRNRVSSWLARSKTSMPPPVGFQKLVSDFEEPRLSDAVFMLAKQEEKSAIDESRTLLQANGKLASSLDEIRFSKLSNLSDVLSADSASTITNVKTSPSVGFIHI